MSVQAGSGGFNVAHHVAEQLGFRYYDWEVTSEAANRAGVPPAEVVASERVPGFLERMMRRLGAVSTVSMEGGPTFVDPSPAMWNTAVANLTSDDYRPFIERVVNELADQGHALIVGHAGQYVLRDRPGVIKVLILGSEGARAKRLMREQNIDEKQALTQVRTSDKDRAELLKKVYKFDWLDSARYDLTINTDNISTDVAIDAIIAAAKNVNLPPR
jgi:cytidylate kinase